MTIGSGCLSLRSLDDASAWFTDRLPLVDPTVEGVAITSVQRVTRGVSRETWMLDAAVARAGVATEEGFVVRRDHEVGSVDPVPLRTEFDVYRRLGPSLVPVAAALWYEDDPAWWPDGRAAYVRRRVEGTWELPVVRSTHPADDEARIAACREHLDKLALVHTCDWEGLGFGELFPVPAGPSDIVPTLIRYFTSHLDGIAFEPCAARAEGLDWLLATAPVAPCVTLCKGTNGLGEEIWRDGRIVALSDWELACLAEPAYDLAQVQEMVPTIERGGRVIWGWREALAHYQAVSGIDVTMERVEYYRRFYAVPMFAFTHHAAHLVVHRANRLVRFAWTGTEMQHQAELRFAAIGGFAPTEFATRPTS